MSKIPSVVRLVQELQRSLYWLVNLLSFVVSKRRIHHIGCLVSTRSLFSAGNWRVMVRFMCQSTCSISPDEVWMAVDTSVGGPYSNCVPNSICYAFYLFNTNRMCMNVSLFCPLDLPFLILFLLLRTLSCYSYWKFREQIFTLGPDSFPEDFRSCYQFLQTYFVDTSNRPGPHPSTFCPLICNIFVPFDAM
jgi:hypothetical protein